MRLASSFVNLFINNTGAASSTRAVGFCIHKTPFNNTFEFFTCLFVYIFNDRY